jgi:hypothetical protein
MEKRTEHCAFKVLDKNGKCIACCHKNVMIEGKYADCLGNENEDIKTYVARVNSERKLH